MSLSKLMVATTFVLSAVAAQPTLAQAQVAEQNQNLNLSTSAHVTCTGTYGQNCTVDVNANGSGNQYQRITLTPGQRVVYRLNGTPVAVHYAADAGLDLKTQIALAGILAVGALALTLKIKSRVA